MDTEEFLDKLALMRVTNDTHRIWFKQELAKFQLEQRRIVAHAIDTKWLLVAFNADGHTEQLQVDVEQLEARVLASL